MKKTILTLALLAAPALAVASPEVAVRQSPAPCVPTTTVPAHSVRARTVLNKFRVTQLLPIQVTVKSMSGPQVRVTFQIGARTALALRQGEIVKLKIVPVRGRP